MPTALFSEELFANPILQALRSSYLNIYDSLFLSHEGRKPQDKATENDSTYTGPILLVTSHDSLARIAIPQSLIEAHVFIPAPLKDRYLNLLGHGVVIQNRKIRGVLGFDQPLEREVLLEEIITDRKSTYKVLLIDSPIPDEWTQDREGEFQHLFTQSSKALSKQLGIHGDRTPQKQATLSQTSFTLSLGASAIKQIVERWKVRWPSFGKELETNLRRLEKSLLLVPGYEQAVAMKYSNLVKSTLLPSLYRAPSLSYSSKAFSALSQSSSESSPSAQVKSRESDSPGEAANLQIHPSNDNKNVIIDILEKFLYCYFQPQLWTFIASATQEQDAMIECAMDNILQRGLDAIGESWLGLPAHTESIGQDTKDRRSQEETVTRDRSSTICSTGPPQLKSRHTMSEESRVASLFEWLRDHRVSRIPGLLKLLLDPIDGCVSHLKKMGVALLPHEKLLAMDEAVVAASKVSSVYLNRSDEGSSFWSIATQYPAEALYEPVCLCLMLSMCLSDVKQFFAHFQFTRMILLDETHLTVFRSQVPSLNVFEVCLQVTLKQTPDSWKEVNICKMRQTPLRGDSSW